MWVQICEIFVKCLRDLEMRVQNLRFLGVKFVRLRDFEMQDPNLRDLRVKFARFVG